MKPSLKQLPLEDGQRYSVNRYINFNQHKITLQISRKLDEETEPLTVLNVQNLRPDGSGSSFKGSLEHPADNRSYDFLYLVDSTVQMSTLSYELVKYFEALLKGDPLPQVEADDPFGGDSFSPSAAPSQEEGISEEDIENMSDDEIQAMMEREVAQTLGGKEDEDAGQDDIGDILASAGGTTESAGGDTEEVLSVDDIQAMLGDAGGSIPTAAEEEAQASQDELNDLLGDLGVSPHNDAPAEEAPAAEASADAGEEEESLSPEEIQKMVAEKQDESPSE